MSPNLDTPSTLIECPLTEQGPYREPITTQLRSDLGHRPAVTQAEMDEDSMHRQQRNQYIIITGWNAAMLRSAREENATFKGSNRSVTCSARLHSPLLITQCGAEERCAHDTSGRTDVQRFERFEIEAVEVGGGLGENQPALNI